MKFNPLSFSYHPPLIRRLFREQLTIRQLAGLLFSAGTQKLNRSSKIRDILFTFCVLVFFGSSFFLQQRGIYDLYLLLSIGRDFLKLSNGMYVEWVKFLITQKGLSGEY